LEGFRPHLAHCARRWSGRLRVLDRRRYGPDLVQEVFARFLRHPVRYAGLPDTELRKLLQRALYRCALNLQRSERRVQARTERLRQRLLTTGAPANPSPLDGLLAGEECDLLGAAIGHLSRKRRCVVVWFYLEGVSVPEISRKLGCGERRVRHLRVLALSDLRRELRAWSECGA
jgi:RNA polymerase sigma factor (sigma-70 family)